RAPPRAEPGFPRAGPSDRRPLLPARRSGVDRGARPSGLPGGDLHLARDRARAGPRGAAPSGPRPRAPRDPRAPASARPRPPPSRRAPAHGRGRVQALANPRADAMMARSREPEPPTMSRPSVQPTVWDRIRNAFLTGLLVLAPATITIYVVWRLFFWVDHLLGTTLRGGYIRPGGIPGLGFLTVLVIILVVGFLANNIL